MAPRFLRHAVYALVLIAAVNLCDADGSYVDSGAGAIQSTQLSGKMKVLHEGARIYLYENFLTPEECDHIIALAEPRLQRSEVVAMDANGAASSEKSDIRTSSGVFLQRGLDDVIAGIEERIAKWALLPVGNGEDMQVLRYLASQKYEPHYDAFFDKDNIANGGNRVATVMTYLNDVEEGGETTFPLIPAPGGENVGFSECAKKVLAVKPKQGTAVLFHNLMPSGQLEQRSLHSACPVLDPGCR